MNENLKRKKIDDYTTSKVRFIESLNNIQVTPPRKNNKNKRKTTKKLEYIQNTKPTEIFQNIFERKDLLNSSEISIKSQRRSKTSVNDYEIKQEEQVDTLALGKIFSKLAEIPERKIEFIETPKKSQSSEGNLDHIIESDIIVNEKIKKRALLDACCTPVENVIKIPQSYRRQKPVKTKIRIQP